MRFPLRWPKKIELPPKEQFLQWFAHMTYIFVGIFFLSLYRMPLHYFICISICGLADLIVGYIRSEGVSVRVPITGFISAGTFFMFTESLHAEVYFFGSLAAVLSKNLFRYNGRHVFNPGNIAVLAVVILLPQYAVSVPGQWGGDWWVILLVAAMGIVIAYLAQRWWVSLSYFLSFVLFSTIRGLIFNISPFFLAGTVIGIPSMIYLFHMVTDPATSPRSTKYQIVYGASVGLIDVFLRYKEVLYAPVIALAIVTAVQPLIHFVSSRMKYLSMNEA